MRISGVKGAGEEGVRKLGGKEHIREVMELMTTDKEQLQAEVERLRYALEQIARTDIHGYCTPHETPRDIAIQTLKGNE